MESHGSKAAQIAQAQPCKRVKAAEVFAITELLEQIVLFLPNADIIRAKSVSRAFHNTIVGSSSTQRKLFYTPCVLTLAECSEAVTIPEPSTMNELLCPGWAQGFTFGHWNFSGREMHQDYGLYKSMRAARYTRRGNVTHISLIAERVETGAYEDGSWRGMCFATLPYEVEITLSHRTFTHTGTLGELVDALDEQYEPLVVPRKLPATWAEEVKGRLGRLRWLGGVIG